MKPHIFPKPIEEIYETLEWKAHPVVHGAGVYKLISDERVIYVGMSNNLCARLAHHMSFRRFFFDRIEYARCRQVEAPYLERIAIKSLDPEKNTKFTSRDRWKSENVRRIEKRWADEAARFVEQY